MLVLIFYKIVITPRALHDEIYMTVRRHETFEDTKVSTKAVNRRTDITLTKRNKNKNTNNGRQNCTRKTKD
jgi:hypothetical protein